MILVETLARQGVSLSPTIPSASPAAEAESVELKLWSRHALSNMLGQNQHCIHTHKEKEKYTL